MATTPRIGSAWHYGKTTSWAATDPYISTTSICRLTFSGVGRIDNIGTITAMSCSIDPRTTTANGGSLYATTNAALLPNQYASATQFGTWSIVDGGAVQNFTVGSFSPSALLSAVGSATTWYMLWRSGAVTSDRSFVYANVFPTFTITYTPGLMHPNVGGVWQTGNAYVNVGGVWQFGQTYANVGGVWQVGT